MIAIKRLQSIMWILVVAFGALTAYLVSLRVATERNAVVKLERQIYETRSNIRYLEVEFNARASMRQLEAWNAEDIRYSVPTAKQYLRSESQLASLEQMQPSGVAAPVPATEMAQAAPAPRAGGQGDFALIKSAVAAEPAVARPAKVAKRAQPDPVTRRAARLALLDEKLLDTGSLGRKGGKATR